MSACAEHHAMSARTKSPLRAAVETGYASSRR
jgi:hypothetical protein